MKPKRSKGCKQVNKVNRKKDIYYMIRMHMRIYTC